MPGCFFKPVDVANDNASDGLFIVIHFWTNKASHDAGDPKIQQRLFTLPLSGLNPIPGQKDKEFPVFTADVVNEEVVLQVQAHPSGDFVDPATLGDNDRIKVETWDHNITEEVRQAIELFWDRNGDAILAGTFIGEDTDAVIISFNQLRRTETDVRNLRSRFDSAALNGYEWREVIDRPDSPDDLKLDIVIKSEKWSDYKHLFGF